MLKRSEYLVMSFSFVFMLAIFLIISINYITDSAASNNEYTDNFIASAHTVDMSKYPTDYVVLSGGDQVVKENVVRALNYAKKGNAAYSQVQDIPADILEGAKSIIVTTGDLTSLGDFDAIMSKVKNGTNIFFAVLPKEGSSLYDRYCSDLGIVSRRGHARIEGFQAFEGLYAQGKIICYDYPLEVEDIRVDATCRKYIFEYSADPDAAQDEMVPLLWRTVYGNGQICILNADFMLRPYSVGLCIAVLCSMETDYAYPIVNAKVNYIDSFPFLSYENGDNMLRFYNRDSQSFIRDQAWPSLVTMMKDSDIKFTGLYYAYITDDGSSSELKSETLSYFKKQFSKYECEFGFGGYHPGIKNDPKEQEHAMETSYNNFKWNMSSYNLVTYKYSKSMEQSTQNKTLDKLDDVGVYVSKLESNRKSDYVAPLSLAENDNNIVNMPIICEEVTVSYEDFWKACNVASGLGLSTHYFDMYDVITNEDDYDYEWMIYSQELAKQFNLLNRGTSWLQQKTSTQAGYSAKRYLCLMPEIEFTDTELKIKCENFDDKATFVVKTSKKFKPDEASYTATKLSDGFYMIEVYKDDVTIGLIDTGSQKYFY